MALLVTTFEHSGIDRYSRELAGRIGVLTLETRRYRSLRNTIHFLHRLGKVSELIHFPSQHFGRFGLFLGKPFIITVHDLVRICFPIAREGIRERIGLKLDAFGLKRAEHIITVSNWTKADLVRHLRINQRRITVIYNGIDHSTFRPLPGSRLEFPYILYVGSERPRKNLGVLLEAFAILKKGGVHPHDLKLVKAGAPGRVDKFRQATVSKVKGLGLTGEVIFTDYVSDEELASYYSSALALVMPSLYEGFGLPVIEAMACGCPVISSNSSSLPEVAGDAALFFNPRDSQQLAHLIRRLAAEPALRHELRRKGLQRAQEFSWERATRATLQVYQVVETRLSLRRTARAQTKPLEKSGVTQMPQLPRTEAEAGGTSAELDRISRNCTLGARRNEEEQNGREP